MIKNPIKLLLICLGSGVMALATTGLEAEILSGKPVMLATLIIFKLWMFIGAPIVLYWYMGKDGGKKNE